MLLIGILVLVLFVAAARGTLEAFHILLPKNIFRRIAGIALIVAAVSAGFWTKLPLPLFYMTVYFTAGCVLISSHDKRQKTFFIINIRFLLFTAIHMIVLGIIALLKDRGIAEVLKDFDLRGMSVSAALAVNTLTDFVFARLMRRSTASILDYDGEEFSLLAGSMWFWVVFLMVDSLPSMFSLPDALVSLFLIGSSFLMLVMVGFYILHVYRIIKNAYLEEEYIRLKQEEERQRQRVARIEKRACTDELTGVYSRAYVMNCLTTMMEAGEAFSIVYIDINSLKHINDTKGHRAGDEYLKTFAAEFGSHLRGSDIFGRIGGDEFLVAMPDCPAETAARRLKEIRDTVAGQDQSKGPFSYGIVYVPAHTEKKIKEYLSEADSLMYEDKKAGRR
ncbi:GGDEF domain-containing protein [Murimonas intestini]|uniref:Diguanylate cyclase (GGDEF)-like protein n=1 Tax=Murimonas intestini TaxID=1337051 RepID=A0AB73T3R3_9FIRM|nr:GGDEF domain-containing protein [Murimonas intestini]MCR1841085.1 GGDEF domain-containing protein [Murimonas intestini]MCR1865797.1 GGDEF domain-containing protein [Murimonas intestini]MCR1883217.1 GGDEF domain-containing protein [Murimonas intestini]